MMTLFFLFIYFVVLIFCCSFWDVIVYCCCYCCHSKKSKAKIRIRIRIRIRSNRIKIKRNNSKIHNLSFLICFYFCKSYFYIKAWIIIRIHQQKMKTVSERSTERIQVSISMQKVYNCVANFGNLTTITIQLISYRTGLFQCE